MKCYSVDSLVPSLSMSPSTVNLLSCVNQSPVDRRTRLSATAILSLLLISTMIGLKRVDAQHDDSHLDGEDDDVDFIWPSSPDSNNSPSYQHSFGPYFDSIHPTNVSVLAGQTIILQCRVIDLGDQVVSWVRQSDLAILASGGISHTSDARISTSADETLNDWQLRIDAAQTKDSGLYECQVNTEPKINWPVIVHVEAAVASIVGASELYVRTGSTISLECVIQGAGSIPPRVLFWFHNGKPIALDSPRGGISLTTSRDTGISPGMSSKLLLTRATMADGGNYTCAPPGAQSANITVHVLNGEHPAAMQRGNRSPSGINGGPSLKHLGAKFLWISQVMSIQYFVYRLATGNLDSNISF